MTAIQYLRIVWARKWLVIALAALVSGIGVAVAIHMPNQYKAQASLVVEVRADPVLGALAQGLTSPGYIATQVEILNSDRVAGKAVRLLGIERSPEAIANWRETTQAKIPMEQFFAESLVRGLQVEAGRGSNLLYVNYSAEDPKFAAAAANAFVQAYMDTSVDLRIAPARQSAQFLEEQTKVLRANLEQAQATLSKYQQDKGIVISDERYDQEVSRLNALSAQLAQAQAERVDANARNRNSGSEMSPDVQQSGAVQTLKSQLATAESKMVEISSIVGPNHPQRQQLEAQISGLKLQLAAEVRRVSGGSNVMSNASSQKVAELRALAEAQKREVLAMRSERDQISVLLRDVETAQRAYESTSQRVTQVNMEGQNSQANVRVLSPAVAPLNPSPSKKRVAAIGAVLGGLLLGAAVAIGLELLDRRIRSLDDMVVAPGVPVIGVLRPNDSKQPVFRRLQLEPRRNDKQPLLPAPGAP
jgi:chain length determinant protein EpsF